MSGLPEAAVAFLPAPTPLRKPVTVDWGLVPYLEAQERQLAQVDARIQGQVPDTLVLTEHPPVYTFGVRKGAEEHLLWNPAMLAQQGVTVVATRRGGDVTCHSPGQLVGYPIVCLNQWRDLHGFLRLMEAALIETVAHFGLAADRREGMTGVWIEQQRKIAAIGVAVRRWVTYHGFALNVANDLAYFSGIVPCGITTNQGGVTSLSQELGRVVSREEVAPVAAQAFWRQFLRKSANLIHGNLSPP